MTVPSGCGCAPSTEGGSWCAPPSTRSTVLGSGGYERAIALVVDDEAFEAGLFEVEFVAALIVRVWFSSRSTRAPYCAAAFAADPGSTIRRTRPEPTSS